jgi:hypothetical protein
VLGRSQGHNDAARSRLPADRRENGFYTFAEYRAPHARAV